MPVSFIAESPRRTEAILVQNFLFPLYLNGTCVGGLL